MKNTFLLILIFLLIATIYGYENEQAQGNIIPDLPEIQTMEYELDDCYQTSLSFCDPLDTNEESYWDIGYQLKTGDVRDYDYVTEEYINIQHRMYITFLLDPISDIPEDAEILSIRLRVHLEGNYGRRNGYPLLTFPYWDGYEQTEHECTLSHVDLGDSLGVEDWNAGEPGNSGTITSNLGVVVSASLSYPGFDPYQYEDYLGYYFVDVTDAVLDDLVQSNSFSQFRIAFMGMETDNDAGLDYLNFSPAGWPRIWLPHLEIDYVLPGDERVYRSNAVTQPQISILPNPVRDLATIDYVLPGVRSSQKFGIYNIRGQRMAEGSINGERGNLQLDMSSYSSGSYLIKVGNSVKRFVLIRN